MPASFSLECRDCPRLAGFLAEAIGVRAAVWVGVSIGFLPPLLLLPLWRLRTATG